MTPTGTPHASLGARARQSLRHTQAPLLWGLAVAALAALIVGSLAAWAVGFRPPATAPQAGVDYTVAVIGRVVPAGLVSAFVVMAGLLVPKEKSAKAVVGVSVLMLAAIFIAWSTVGHPLWSGVAMAAIMGLAALAVRQSPALAAAGMVLSNGYFFFGVIGLVRGLSGADALELGLTGAGAAIVMLVVLSVVRRATGFRLVKPPPAKSEPSDGPRHRVGWFAPGPVLRYAILRAVMLGIAVGFYAATDDHNLFWVLLTIWVVLQPAPDSTFDKAVRRVGGVMVGCLLIGALSQAVPPEVILIVAVAALFVGLLFYARSYTVYAAGISFMVVALFGAADNGHFVTWAGLRTLDTIIGAAISLLAYFLVVSLPDRRRSA